MLHVWEDKEFPPAGCPLALLHSASETGAEPRAARLSALPASFVPSILYFPLSYG